MVVLTSIVFCALPILITASTVQQHYSHVPLAEIMRSVMSSCQRKTGASSDAAAKVHEYGQLEVSRAAKCMLFCAMRTFGSIDKTGTNISTDSMDLYITSAFTPDNHDKVLVIWNNCIKKVKRDPDHCQYSYDLAQCFIGQVNKDGLTIIPFW